MGKNNYRPGLPRQWKHQNLYCKTKSKVKSTQASKIAIVKKFQQNIENGKHLLESFESLEEVGVSMPKVCSWIYIHL